MNRRQKLFVAATAIIVCFVALGTGFYTLQNKPADNQLKAVATFYPLAFFTQEIGGEKVTVKQLMPDNTEVHTWQPSFGDILVTEEADVIIYNGKSLDHWFKDDILPIINSSDKVIVETTEGIQLLDTNQETSINGHKHKLENGDNHDPHTWISPFIAKQQAQKIFEALVQKDPENQEYYSERWQNTKARLETLDNDYMSGLSNTGKEAVFVAHSAFGYLGDRYGFDQHGVIGISADEQPSASVYVNLVEMMIEYETYVLYVDPVYADESAQTLKTELQRLSGQDVKILELYFMLGSIDGLDYFDQQARNLENLKIGLEASTE
jgi:zinc transport system substrate-binding protein